MTDDKEYNEVGEELKRLLNVEHKNMEKMRDMYAEAVGHDYPRLEHFMALCRDVTLDHEKHVADLIKQITELLEARVSTRIKFISESGKTVRTLDGMIEVSTAATELRTYEDVLRNIWNIMSAENAVRKQWQK